MIRVFDSVMRGYPVGSFLSWRVMPDTISDFKFYGFMKDYSAFDNRHNPVIDIPTDREVVAILDGQQRLTRSTSGFEERTRTRTTGGGRTNPGRTRSVDSSLTLLAKHQRTNLG